MQIEYRNKKYNKIKELLADTTIKNLDEFLIDGKKITLDEFIKLQEQENLEDANGSASNSSDYGSANNSGYGSSASNSGYSGSASNSGWYGSANNSGRYGSASNSGYSGSASNSGEYGISTSNSFFGKVTNKEGCYSFITEPILNNSNEIISQNATVIKFTKEMEGKYYTLLKNKIFEVVSFDNISMIILKTENKNGYTIYNGVKFNDTNIYQKSKKLADIPIMYVVSKDGINSHGETIEQAIADFRYKISNRDLSEFEYFKTTKDAIPVDEIIKGYRVITGACEFGTKQFVEGLNEVEESYTIAEALKILEQHNAWGLDKFKEFLNKE